jgi:hypothetical protein
MLVFLASAMFAAEPDVRIVAPIVQADAAEFFDAGIRK